MRKVTVKVASEQRETHKTLWQNQKVKHNSQLLRVPLRALLPLNNCLVVVLRGSSKRKFACNRCHEVGHLAGNCPHPLKTTKLPEAPGRSDNSRSRVAAVEASYVADDLTVEQLEELLSRKRLTEEQKGLKDNLGTVSAVTASATEIGAIGPTLFLDVLIEGEKVEGQLWITYYNHFPQSTPFHCQKHAMSRMRTSQTDTTRAQAVWKRRQKRAGHHSSDKLTIEADGKSACVPVFIQPAMPTRNECCTILRPVV